ncbi:MAG TPA: NADH-quinone oxidoreductase subunit G [Leucothrix mucor]|nr:NADH-quinone oxidoreductase subunit G [Leucothrix mucor]
MSEELVTIKINDEEIQVKAGSMLIEAADDAGIHIPRFCYHKKLSIAANCRMCLVEVERAPKPMPACATPVNDGMKVWTRSEKALSAQKDNMEFLLINHPLDCPICDQGGECELQDLAVKSGGSSSNFQEIKRVVVDKDIGSLVSTEMTRCIQCTRCIRFGEEIAGLREMGALGRGDRMEIGTFVEQSLQSELSGNIIDICPVGALTAKPSRYKARPWEVVQTPSIASHDSVGSNIYLHSFKDQVVRTVSRENEAVNDCWISDRDRFSYEGLNAEDRLHKPMIKQDGVWREIEWAVALEAVAERIKATDVSQLGALVSPRATLEEQYLLQKMLRACGVNNIDHRLRQSDFYDQELAALSPLLGVSIADLEAQNAVLLVGSNVRQEQPMVNHRLRKAALKGANIMAVNPRQYEFNYDVTQQLIGDASSMLDNMAAIAMASGNVSSSVDDLLQGVEVTDAAKEIVNNLKDSDKAVILLGNMAVSHPQYSALRALAVVIAENTGAVLGSLVESANTVGAWIAGAIPHRQSAGQDVEQAGKNVSEMLTSNLKMFMLLDVEPEFDCEDPQLAMAAMIQAECVVAITPFASETLKSYADILLPASTFAETSGTFVNLEGTWQSFRAASKLPADARPTWKILRVLGNALEVAGFDYVSSEDVRSELQQDMEAATRETTSNSLMQIYQKHAADSGLQRVSEVASYSVDSLVRRAVALHTSSADTELQVYLHSLEAEKLGLAEGSAVNVIQGSSSTVAKIAIDDSVSENCILILGGTELSANLGASFGAVELGAV